MEWVLQVVDEIDDVIATMRHRCVGVATELGIFAGSAAAAAVWAAFLVGR
jgi:cysteine synthase